MERVVMSRDSAPLVPRDNRKDPNGPWASYDAPDCQNNLLPQDLLAATLYSPTNAGIIAKKAAYTVAGGFSVEGPDAAVAQAMLDTVDEGDGVQRMAERMAYDWHMFGGYCVEVLWKRYLDRVATARHTDFSTVRKGWEREKNEDGIYEPCVWLSSDWRDIYKRVNKPASYPLFTPNARQDRPAFLYYAEYTPGRKIYPLPKWFSGFKAVLTEGELLEYDYRNVVNSFNPSGVLTLPYEPDPEQQERLRSMVAKDLIGAENAGKLMVVFSDAEKASEFTPVSATPEDRGIDGLLARQRQSIVIAHSLPSPTVVGLPGGASLGGDGGTIETAAYEFKESLMQVKRKIAEDLTLLLTGLDARVVALPNQEETTATA